MKRDGQGLQISQLKGPRFFFAVRFWSLCCNFAQQPAQSSMGDREEFRPVNLGKFECGGLFGVGNALGKPNKCRELGTDD